MEETKPITEKMKTQLENPKGLHKRYYIQKIVNYNGLEVLEQVDHEAEYYVLRLDTGGSDIEHIKAGRIGINAYADAIKHHLPELAKDLRERYPLL